MHVGFIRVFVYKLHTLLGLLKCLHKIRKLVPLKTNFQYLDVCKIKNLNNN